MQDWDRWILLILGVGVSGYSLYHGWRDLVRGRPLPAAGAALLALLNLLVPLALALFGG